MPAESRRFPRAPLLATAVLHRGTRAIGSFRVINGSAGGLLLAGDVPAETEGLSVLVRLPADQFVRAPAVVVRTEVQRGRPAFALAFCGLSSNQHRVVEMAVAAALDDARTAAVLILDGDVGSTEALRGAIARFGYRSFPVATFLEMAHVLERPNKFCIVFVADGVSAQLSGWANGPEVLDYLAGRHPDLRRILVADGETLRSQRSGPAARPGELPHETLVKPWTESRLGDVLANLAPE